MAVGGKTASKSASKAAVKAPKKSGDAKKRKSKRTESYSSYIYKVLKQVSTQRQIAALTSLVLARNPVFSKNGSLVWLGALQQLCNELTLPLCIANLTGAPRHWHLQEGHVHHELLHQRCV
jgi:hypothetical protein